MHTRSRHVVREWVLRRIASWDCLGKIIFTQFPVQRRNSPGPGPFSFMGRGLASIFGQIVSVRIKKLSIINLVASSHITNEKASLPVDVRRSEKTLFNLPNKRRQCPKTVPWCNSKQQRPSLTKHLKMASRLWAKCTITSLYCYDHNPSGFYLLAQVNKGYCYFHLAGITKFLKI